MRLPPPNATCAVNPLKFPLTRGVDAKRTGCVKISRSHAPAKTVETGLSSAWENMIELEWLGDFEVFPFEKSWGGYHEKLKQVGIST